MVYSREKKIAFFQAAILDWFEECGRTFPWRKKSATNYEKIVSEVLLQRTKAETVAKFFPQFIKRYSSWRQLGLASEQDLQEALRPLGLYNQRGTRLYKLAQEMKQRNGRFPTKRSEVEEMSMMGQYITNAYEMFILNRPAPLLDVNMARVLERFFGPRKLADIRYDPYLQELSKNVVDHPKHKEINWAVLDFAALVCRSKNPHCQTCILNSKCFFLSTTSK